MSLVNRGVAGSQAGERLRRCMGVGVAHGSGAGYEPRQRMSSGFFGELNQAAPSGDSLPGFAADPCCAFRCPLAVPTAHQCRAFRRFPVLRSGEGGSGWWSGAVERPGWFWQLGHGGLAGMRMPGARHGSGRSLRQGSGRGPGAGDGFGDFSGNSTRLRLAAFLCRASRQIPAALSSAFLPCLMAHRWSAFRRSHAMPPAYPCRALGAPLPFGPGKLVVVRWRGVVGGSGCLGGIRGVAGSRAGGAGGVAGDGFGVCSGNSTGLRPAAFLCRVSRPIPAAALVLRC